MFSVLQTTKSTVSHVINEATGRLCVGLTKKEVSWKVGVSGVPWLYTDTRLWSAVALLTLPDDRVKSSASKGLEGGIKINE